MRTKVLLLLALVITNVFCALESKQQGALISKNMRETLEKNELGRAIIGMLEMSSDMGSNADLSKLYEALKLLKESLLQQKEDEVVSFEADQDFHDKEVARLEGNILLFGNQITIFTEQLKKLVADGAQLQTDLNNQNQQLTDANKSREDIESSIKKLEAKYNKESEDFKEVIALLERAQAKLLEAKGGNQGGDALIQLASENSAFEFENIAKLLEKSANKVKNSFLFTPIQNVFTQLTKKGQVSDDALNRAFDALNDLQKFYEAGLEQLGRQYQSELDKQNGLLTNVKVQIGTLNNVVIPKTKSDIEANTLSQEAKQGELTDAGSNKRLNEKNLKEENESFEKRVESHNLLLPEYDDEYAVVVKAEQILRNANPSFVEIDEDSQ